MSTDLHRRTLLRHTAWLLASGAVSAPALAQSDTAPSDTIGAPPLPSRVRLAAAWRSHGNTPDCGRDCDQVGVLELDWAAREVRVAAHLPVQGRAHGLLAEPGGGFLAVATRPGRWLLRDDPPGELQTRHLIDAETPHRTLGGHVLASADGQWLYTTETDTRDGRGWIGVRDHRTLQRVAQWPSHGLDPHHMALDAGGALLVVNGGIPRTASGQKTRLEAMDPSLVRLEPRSGALLGRWRLGDPRLSLRHVACRWAPATAHRRARRCWASRCRPNTTRPPSAATPPCWRSGTGRTCGWPAAASPGMATRATSRTVPVVASL